MTEVEVAWVGRDGVILATNAAWEAFRVANGGDSTTCSVGASYLDACDAGGDPASQAVATAIRAAAGGSLFAPFVVEIPCDAPDDARWFRIAVMPRAGDRGEPLGATVSLWRISAPQDDADVTSFVDHGVAVLDPDGLLRLDREPSRHATSVVPRSAHALVPAPLAVLNDLTTQLWRAPSLEAGLDELLAVAVDLAGADTGCIYLRDAPGAPLRRAAQRGPVDTFPQILTEVPPRVRATPLVSWDETELGLLCTVTDGSHSPSTTQLRWLDVYARLAATFVERRRADDELRASAARLEAALAAMSDAVSISDVDGELTHCNQAFATFHRFATTECARTLATYPSRLEVRFPDGTVVPPDQRALRRALRGESGTNVEYDLRRLDTGDRWDGSYNFAPIRSATGEIIGSVVTSRDITERKSREEALRRTRRLEAVGQLAGGVAHDLNNLLTVINGSLELARSQTDDEGIARLLDRAADAAQRGARFSDRLLALARRGTLRAERIDLNRSVRDNVLLLGAMLGPTIEIVTEPTAGLWPTFADPGGVADTILNLASNARAAMPNGGVLSISTTNQTLTSTRYGHGPLHPDARDADYVRLRVADTGYGMTPDVLEHALEPFFTTKPDGEGTGLGVSSVASFAAQSGGFLTITSEAGIGTIVDVYLPRGDWPSPHPSGTPGESATAPGPGERVLVVEDDDAVREVTVDRVAALGYDVVAACNGGDAITLLRDDPTIAVVLSDVVMPGDTNGFAVAQWVATHRPELHVVLSSGYAPDRMHPDGDGGPVPDGVAMLAKPYSQGALRAALRRAST